MHLSFLLESFGIMSQRVAVLTSTYHLEDQLAVLSMAAVQNPGLLRRVDYKRMWLTVPHTSASDLPPSCRATGANQLQGHPEKDRVMRCVLSFH